ncbi:LysR family transcriptional regulator [Bordetella genomosp. 4]|uniref:Transcriptional regulator n=1 Tax=Bordetella genomosp. 4 TaxID=463044 RepID=A0A261TUE3_9BORD|nr:LysR family transcriptional regulator [Bordetella genomosp. 4]OZI52857.1 transcriptional regulator [Bordetella genomosp. 4]
MDRLRAMELFLSISKTESFSETARQFGVSATSVSRMITDFESELNVKLLLRSTRQVVLTEAGQEYARELEGILWNIDQAHRNITEIRAAPKGTLRVHSRMMFGLGVLPPLVAAFRQKYPDIHIELVLSEAKTDLRRNNFDIDFRISPPVEASLKRRILFKSERYLVASPAYLAKRARPERPADIAQHDCLAYLLPGDQYRWRFKQADAIEEVLITPRHVTNNGVALLELARLGEGVALLDDYTVHHDIARGTLIRLCPEYRVTNTTFEEGMYATILDTAMIPAKIRLFLDFVASHVSGDELRFTAYGKSTATDSD